jgi:hypothetical protein
LKLEITVIEIIKITIIEKHFNLTFTTSPLPNVCFLDNSRCI